MAFGDCERSGAESYQKTIHHPPVGQCHRVQRPPYLYRDEMEEVGGEVPVTYRPGRPPIGFACSRYPPAISSCVRTTRPPAWLAPLVLPPSLGARGGTGLRGGRFAGLLDMTVSFDGLVGCSRTTKASEIGISPGSGCTQALAYRL